MAKLEREQIVTIRVLSERGQSASQTARLLGVTEGTVRYHLCRQGAADGRAKEFLVERLGLADGARRDMATTSSAKRRNIKKRKRGRRAKRQSARSRRPSQRQGVEEPVVSRVREPESLRVWGMVFGGGNR